MRVAALNQSVNNVALITPAVELLARAAAYRATPHPAPGGATGPGGAAATDTDWPSQQAALPDPTGTGGRVTEPLPT
jgi:hypothetical protein